MNRLPVCVGLTHRQIWAHYRELYPELSRSELRAIHLKWVNAYSDLGKKGKSS